VNWFTAERPGFADLQGGCEIEDGTMKLLASALTAGGLVLGGSGAITLSESEPPVNPPERTVVEQDPHVWERMGDNFGVWVAQTQDGFEQHLIGYCGFTGGH
jgi:hypothetical protein